MLRIAARNHLRATIVAAMTAVLFSTIIALPAGAAGKGGGRPRSKDTVAPSVSIASPAPGATVSGAITVSGSASDNGSVGTVNVAVDSSTPQPATGTSSWSALIDTAGLADGTHVITARAVDAAGNAGTASVTVSVANAPAPSPSPSSEPSPSPSPSPSPTAGASPPPDPGVLVTPEGVVINVDTASSWTALQVYDLLKANALDLAKIGPSLSVFVQDTQNSGVTTGSGCCVNGRYDSFTAYMFLDARPDKTFTIQPDATVAHEYGHVWTLYHLYMSQNGDWSSYLAARGLSADSRLDSTYAWMRTEIIADDYRLLFGSATAISQRPRHLNPYIADPRDVPGLRDFFLTWWGVPH